MARVLSLPPRALRRTPSYRYMNVCAPSKLLERRGVRLYKSWARRTMNVQCTYSPTPAVIHCNKPPPVLPWQSWSQRIELSDGKYKSRPPAPRSPHSSVRYVCVRKQGCRYVNTASGAIHLLLHILFPYMLCMWPGISYSIQKDWDCLAFVQSK